MALAAALMLALAGEAAAASKQRGYLGWGEFGATRTVPDGAYTHEFAVGDTFPFPFSIGYLGDYFLFGGSANHAFAIDASAAQVSVKVADWVDNSANGDETFRLINLLPGYRYHFSGTEAGGYVGGGLLVRLLSGGAGGTAVTFAATGGYEWDIGAAGVIMGLHLVYAPPSEFDDFTDVGAAFLPITLAYSVGVPIN